MWGIDSWGSPPYAYLVDMYRRRANIFAGESAGACCWHKDWRRRPAEHRSRRCCCCMPASRRHWTDNWPTGWPLTNTRSITSSHFKRTKVNIHEKKQKENFLPRDAMPARYMLSSCVRLSVCPSVYILPPNGGEIGYNWRLLTSVLLCLRNGARHGCSYYGALIGSL